MPKLNKGNNMRKQAIIEAINNGAELAYNMFEVRHELHISDSEVHTVRANTALQIKEELELVEVKQDYHNRFKCEVYRLKKFSNNTYMSKAVLKDRLEKAKKRDEDNGITQEIILVKEKEVKEINHNTFEYRGHKVSCYGEASEFNNMAIEGWIRDEEYSVIYSEGYSTYKEAVKVIVNDTIKRYGVDCLIEQIEFV